MGLRSGSGSRPDSKGCDDDVEALATEHIQASYDAGVLTLRIPIAEQAKPPQDPSQCGQRDQAVARLIPLAPGSASATGGLGFQCRARACRDSFDAARGMRGQWITGSALRTCSADRIEESVMVFPVLRRNHEARDHGVGSLRSWSSPPGSEEPWTEFSELYERMGRLLVEGVDGSAPGSGWWPAADVEETDQAYLVELELPGVKREDISVEVAGGELTVTGEVKERQRVGLLRSRARRVGRFDYRVSLPAGIEEDEVSASLTGGVLTIQVPKTEQNRPRKIPISS